MDSALLHGNLQPFRATLAFYYKYLACPLKNICSAIPSKKKGLQNISRNSLNEDFWVLIV